MKTLLKFACIMIVAFSVVACGGGGGDSGDNLTPLSSTDRSTFYGTFRIDRADISCQNGTVYSSTDPKVNTFNMYVAYEQDKYYTDLYLVYDGDSILDEAEILDYSGSGYSQATTYITGQYTATLKAYNIPLGNTYCNVNYYFSKISNRTIKEYFRVLTSRLSTADAKEKTEESSTLGEHLRNLLQ